MKQIQPLIYAILIIIGIYIGTIGPRPQHIVDNKLNNILQIINNNYVDSINKKTFENKLNQIKK